MLPLGGASSSFSKWSVFNTLLRILFWYSMVITAWKWFGIMTNSSNIISMSSRRFMLYSRERIQFIHIDLYPHIIFWGVLNTLQ